MKSTLILLLSAAVALAESAKPFDAAAAKSTLSEKPDKPRFIPKSAVKSRTYGTNSKGIQVEIVQFEGGEREERPYVPVPILFVVGSAELLDDVSRRNVAELAAVLKELQAAGAKFTVQGHTSAEGEAGANKQLSQKRAAKILSMLTGSFGVDASGVSAVAFGEEWAAFPDTAPENQLQKDRRVLVVRQ